MAVLHLVNRSPHASRGLEQCLARVAAGDAVLLLESAVYAAFRDSQAAAPLRAALPDLLVYALEADLAARGIAPAEIVEGITAIDYDGFVDLTQRFVHLQSWF